MEEHTISGIRINDTTIGLEDLIIIGVEARGTVPVSFAFLEQAGLRGTSRSRGDDAHPLIVTWVLDDGRYVQRIVDRMY